MGARHEVNGGDQRVNREHEQSKADRWASVSTVAEQYELSKRTVRRLIDTGQIVACQMAPTGEPLPPSAPGRRTIRISLASVDAYLQRTRMQPVT